MPIGNPNGIRQVCQKCGWKNPRIEYSDVILPSSECPECGSTELKYKELNTLDKLLKIFNK